MRAVVGHVDPQRTVSLQEPVFCHDFRPQQTYTARFVSAKGQDMKGTKDYICQAEKMPHPNHYIKMLLEDYREWALNEEQAPNICGRWRESVFAVADETPLDLEIGTGNGYHFAHQALRSPERLLVGLELKYKPLIQSIRRARRGGAENVRMVRYNAAALNDIFAPGELNNVYIHFPDPWPRKSKWKHRLVQDAFLATLFQAQREGAWVEFKTDSRCYFDYALERFSRSAYRVGEVSYDLQNSPFRGQNFVTQFESLFLRQGLPIHYARLMKNPG